MKFIKPFPILLFVIFLFSCSEGPVHYNEYYRAFFLGEDSFFIDGEIFTRYDFTTPATFSTIVVRTESADGWEISGTKKSGSKFEFMITNSGNGLTLSKETIKSDVISGNGIPIGSPVALLQFYIDDNFPYQSYPGYKEPRQEAKGEYDYFGYDYVYVPEAMDFSRTEQTESNYPWPSITTHHYDLNFTRPGWYKICKYDRPVNNDSKHSSGRNTCFSKE